MRIKVVTDSGSDISNAEAEEMGIRVIPLKINWGNETYQDGVTISREEFYEKLGEREDFPTTSQISPYEYGKVFEEELINNDAVVCIALSSGVSGSFQSACVAAEDYEGRVVVIDSLNVTVGQRMVVNETLRLIEDGCEFSELKERVHEARDRVRVMAVLDTLEYLKRGGRISATVAFAGTLLNVKPMVEIIDGKVQMAGQARGKKAGLKKLSEMICAVEKDTEATMIMAYSGCDSEGLVTFRKEYENLFLENKRDERNFIIGAVIGTHAGPGAVAVAFLEKNKQ